MYRIDHQVLIGHIKRSGARRVCIQLPDGLKAKALELQEAIRKELDVEVIFWAGSSFGACDLPVGLEKAGIDLLIHLGHTEWVY